MWHPTENMYCFEVAAICGVTVPMLKKQIEQLTAEKKILPEWQQKHILRHPAVTVLINHYNIDCSIEQQIITILSIAREKNFSKRKKRYNLKLNK